MNIAACASALAVVLTTAIGCFESRTDIHRGFLIIGPEVETFTLCGTDDPLWLDYSLALRKVLFERYELLRTAPYDQTYAELRGTPGPKLNCGFCEDYSGSFKVVEIILQRTKSPTDCHDT